MLLQRFARAFKKSAIGTFDIEDTETNMGPGDTRAHSSRTMGTMRGGNMKKSRKMNYSEISYGSDSDDDSAHPKQTKEDIYYYFHKMLSDDSYTLGKHMSEYIESFHIQYKSIKESASLLPLPMDSLVSMINETVKTFYTDYNMGKQD